MTHVTTTMLAGFLAGFEITSSQRVRKQKDRGFNEFPLPITGHPQVLEGYQNTENQISTTIQLLDEKIKKLASTNADIKKSYSGRTLENTEKGAMSMEVKIHFDAVETSLANIRSKSQSLEISKLEEAGAQYHLSALNHIAEVDQRLEQILASYQSVTLKNEAAAKKAVQEIKAYDEQLGESFEGRPMSR